jgi:flavodoxin
MKILVLYDSTFGNTKLIAETIAKNIGENVPTKLVSEFSANDLNGVTCLIAGSPIIGWKPSENMAVFLASLKTGQLKGVKVTAFDTRVKFFHGDAANKISKALEDAGGRLFASPQYFFVKGSQGPLFADEIEKAVSWAKALKKSL